MIILREVNPSPSFLLTNPVALLGFGFGSGLSPVVPGTMGTLAAVPLYLLMSSLALHWYLLIVLVAIILGIFICGVTADKLGVHDHGGIVWDEFVGLWITMIAAPSGWAWLVAGFVLFRFFDMVKPWPIDFIDRHMKGGLGIMFDDIIAGIMALALMQSAHFAIARWL